MFRLLVVLLSLISWYCSIAQEYGSYVFVDDTLGESGNFILLQDSHVYTMSKTRCQPLAQSCGLVRKYNTNLELLWSTYLPFFSRGNDNSLHVYNDSVLIAVGRKNMIDQEEGFYHYTLTTNGEILDLTTHPLPYESNFNYGSLIHNNTLYMYGATEEDVSNPEIDVDALITTYNLKTGEQVNDYFDYGENFGVDLYDLQNNSDSTLVFISRRRNFSYGSERDYVIEQILPDGSRKEFYKVLVPSETGIKGSPSLSVLKGGRMAFFKPDETGKTGSKTIRIIDHSGEFLYDVIIWEQIWTDYADHYDMTQTSDGGFIISGIYVDRTDLTESTLEQNGMLLKVDNQGELAWVRQYRHDHNGTGETTRSFLFDVKEMPNGDIIATGVVENTTSDLWVIKTNSEGCLGDDDCGETTVGIEEEILQINFVNLYPNPVISGQNLQVEVSSQITGRINYQLVDMQGKSIMQGFISRGQNSINTSQISTGIYTIVIDLGKRGVENHKIVIN